MCDVGSFWWHGVRPSPPGDDRQLQLAAYHGWGLARREPRYASFDAAPPVFSGGAACDGRPPRRRDGTWRSSHDARRSPRSPPLATRPPAACVSDRRPLRATGTSLTDSVSLYRWCLGRAGQVPPFPADGRHAAVSVRSARRSKGGACHRISGAAPPGGADAHATMAAWASAPPPSRRCGCARSGAVGKRRAMT